MLTQCVIISHFHQILWFHINHVKFFPVTSKGIWVPAIFRMQIRIVLEFICFILFYFILIVYCFALFYFMFLHFTQATRAIMVWVTAFRQFSQSLIKNLKNNKKKTVEIRLSNISQHELSIHNLPIQQKLYKHLQVSSVTV